MTKTLILKNNGDLNPYFEVFENFLRRILFLRGTIQLLNHSTINLDYAGTVILLRGLNSHPVFFEERFELDLANKKESFERLKNYLFLSMVAQSLETFETYNKDMFRKTVSFSIDNLAILDFALKQLPRTNLELMTQFEKINKGLSVIFDSEFRVWFSTVEAVRHRITHNNQTATPEFVGKFNNKYFNEHFELKAIEHSVNSRICLKSGEYNHIFSHFEKIATSIFKILSDSGGYKIELHET